MDSDQAASASDRMLVAMFDVSGMSDVQVRSLEASIKGYAHVRYFNSCVYDGGPVSLRVCRFEVAEELQGRWAPQAAAA